MQNVCISIPLTSTQIALSINGYVSFFEQVRDDGFQWNQKSDGWSVSIAAKVDIVPRQWCCHRVAFNRSTERKKRSFYRAGLSVALDISH